MEYDGTTSVKPYLRNFNNIIRITCIIFRIDPEVCKRRVSQRTDHPTIGPGEEGKSCRSISSITDL